MRFATVSSSSAGPSPCKVCIYVHERIRGGYQHALPSICVELHAKTGSQAAFGVCQNVMAALSVSGENVKHWMQHGCYKSETYGAMELIKPCPSHVVCNQLRDLDQQPFCKPEAPHAPKDEDRDCEVGQWSQWSGCSKSCAGGTQTRSLPILRPANGNGKPCPEKTKEERKCNEQPCAVHCKVSDWGAWGECSKKCGGGEQTRKRTVVKPAEHGGKACPALEEKQPCNRQPCSIDCVVSEWGHWGDCSKACGPDGVQQRTRTVTTPAMHGGKDCPALHETKPCNRQPCAVSCVVSAWGEWGACSAACGPGEQVRTRTVVTEAAHGGAQCPVLRETKPCELRKCAVACTVSPWSDWSKCSKDCGPGDQFRTRTITTQPAHGGASCPPLRETQNCQIRPCAMDCVVSGWSGWGTCSAWCGQGTQSRSRSIVQQPAHGGAACPVLTESQGCFLQACAVSCAVSAWGPWSTCSASCGQGTQTRSRSILTQPAHGGAACPTLTESQACFPGACPVNCVVSGWGGWSACSANCGGGWQSRSRSIITPASNGGAGCPALTESVMCNNWACPQPAPVWTNGDPHVMTLAGKQRLSKEVGEVWYLRTCGGAFEVQARQTECGLTKGLTCVNALAARVGGVLAAVDSVRERFSVGGEVVPFGRHSTRTIKNVTVTLNGTTLHMRNAAGEMLDYVSANGRGTVSLVLQSSVVPVAWGIYGTHEGSWAGACDGKKADGKPQDWAVAGGASLLREAGFTSSVEGLPAFRRVSTTLRADGVSEAEARRLCKEKGFEGHLADDCVFDIVNTGDTAYLSDYETAQAQEEEAAHVVEEVAALEAERSKRVEEEVAAARRAFEEQEKQVEAQKRALQEAQEAHARKVAREKRQQEQVQKRNTRAAVRKEHTREQAEKRHMRQVAREKRELEEALKRQTAPDADRRPRRERTPDAAPDVAADGKPNRSAASELRASMDEVEGGIDYVKRMIAEQMETLSAHRSSAVDAAVQGGDEAAERRRRHEQEHKEEEAKRRKEQAVRRAIASRRQEIEACLSMIRGGSDALYLELKRLFARTPVDQVCSALKAYEFPTLAMHGFEEGFYDGARPTMDGRVALFFHAAKPQLFECICEHAGAAAINAEAAAEAASEPAHEAWGVAVGA